MKRLLRWKVGDVRITRVQEFEAPGIGFLLPEATRENVATIDWIGPYVDERGEADRTRRDFLARHADSPTLVIGTHFAGPTAGRLVRDGEAYHLVEADARATRPWDAA